MRSGRKPARRVPPPARRRVLSPAQTIAAAFAAAVALGTALLMLPIAKAGPGGTGFMDALFHATSAMCVTGLSTVDTATHWTAFGQAVLLLLLQLGGLGLMTFASILSLLVARRIGLRSRLNTAAESGTLNHGDLRRILWGVARISFFVEVVVALAVALRWWLGYDESLLHSLWLGVFHSAAAFNNAGFALFSDNLIGFVGDPFICLPLAAATIIGGLGFPVLLELRREFGAPLHWSLNTRIVVAASAVLIIGGAALVTGLEWSNPRTLGALDVPQRVLAGFFQSVQTRTSGFNSVDVGALHPETWFVMDLLMFIGGGPASTSGGIKVTTAAILVYLVVSEVRGDGAVNVLGRRLPRSTHRQAITVATMSMLAVVVGTLLLMVFDRIDLDRSLFEVVSAFSTTGLSTGITASLSTPSQLVLVVLMFAGRLGPITLASAIALRRTSRLYELPKERPIIG